MYANTLKEPIELHSLLKRHAEFDAEKNIKDISGHGKGSKHKHRRHSTKECKEHKDIPTNQSVTRQSQNDIFPDVSGTESRMEHVTSCLCKKLDSDSDIRHDPLQSQNESEYPNNVQDLSGTDLTNTVYGPVQIRQNTPTGLFEDSCNGHIAEPKSDELKHIQSINSKSDEDLKPKENEIIDRRDNLLNTRTRRPKHFLPNPPLEWRLNELLQVIAPSIEPEELSKIKLMFSGPDGLSKRVIGQCDSCFKLFMILKEKGYISRDNILYLNKILYMLERQELIKRAEQYCRYEGDVMRYNFVRGEPDTGSRNIKFHVTTDVSNFDQETIVRLRKYVASIVCASSEDVIISAVEPGSSFPITPSSTDMFAEVLKEPIEEHSLQFRPAAFEAKQNIKDVSGNQTRIEHVTGCLHKKSDSDSDIRYDPQDEYEYQNNVQDLSETDLTNTVSDPVQTRQDTPTGLFEDSCKDHLAEPKSDEIKHVQSMKSKSVEDIKPNKNITTIDGRDHLLNTHSVFNSKTRRPKQFLPKPPFEWRLNELLQDIASSIEPEEFSMIKQMFSGSFGIGKRTLRQCDTCYELFIILKERGFISRDNILYLNKILYMFGKQKLIERAEQYCRNEGDVMRYNVVRGEPDTGSRNTKVHVTADVSNIDQETIDRLRNTVAIIACAPREDVIISAVEPGSSFPNTPSSTDMYAEALKEPIEQHRILRRSIAIEAEQFTKDKEAWTHCFSQNDFEHEARRLLYEGILPDRCILKQICQKKGRRSKVVQTICQSICLFLKQQSRQICDVWAAYRCKKISLSEDTDIVFVILTLEPIDIKTDFQICQRCINDISPENVKENSEIKIKENVDKLESGKMKELTKCLKSNAKRLMEKHRKLNRVTLSWVKSRGFGSKDSSMQTTPCVALYVQIKGLAPINEQPFDEYVDGYLVDVREGVFTLCGSPTHLHQNVKMGCALDSGYGTKRGTIGPFFRFETDPHTYLLTSAHVLLDPEQMKKLINDKCVYYGISGTDAYQPPESLSFGNNKRHYRLGRLELAIYRKGGDNKPGMEIALVRIDKSRVPIDCKFPDISGAHASEFSQDNPFEFSTENVCNIISTSSNPNPFVYKYGSVTGITKGQIRVQGASVRTSTLWDDSLGFEITLHEQIEIESVDGNKFGEVGDSGSLVLQRDGGSLAPVGIFEGKSGDIYMMTPITDIKQTLSETLSRHKEPPSETDMEVEDNSTIAMKLYYVRTNNDSSQSNSTSRDISKEVARQTAEMQTNIIHHTEHKFGSVKEELSTIKLHIDSTRNDLKRSMNRMKNRVIENIRTEIGTLKKHFPKKQGQGRTQNNT